jgi:phage FluMu protein gp41
MKLSKDNPLLTAYALGELGACEAAEVEAAILADESLRAQVEAIRSLAGELEGELSAEPMPHLSALERARLEQRAEELDRAAAAGAVCSRRGLRWVAVAAAVLLAAGAVGMWALLRPGGPTVPNIAHNGPKQTPPDPGPGPMLVPTPSPYAPDPVGTPAYVRQNDFFMPSHPSVGSALLSAAGQSEPTTRSGLDDECVDNPWTSAVRRPGSTFGLNVDDASYRYVRQLIFEESRLPEPSAVRIEEMINYFQYDYTQVSGGEVAGPLSVRADLAQCPWSAGHVLLRVAIQARAGTAQAGAGAAEIVARDARVSVTFDPGAIASWRLIGFDGPMSDEIRWHGDQARWHGEQIAAGRQVTALYELVPAGKAGAGGRAILATACATRVDYRLPDGGARVIAVNPGGPAVRFEDAPEDFRFAATVAGFGMILRNSPHKGTCTVAGMLRQAQSALGDDRLGRRSEFVAVLREATGLLPAEE